jgi:Ni,Fe-hydrogenase I large subunit
MANRIVIDPITRIEGHLRIEAEIKDGVVVDAYSSGTMVRGIEKILKGRDPRDAWAFTQRACGVCTTVHALALVRCVEDALGIVVPPNAEIIRNIIACVQQMHDHVVHFYHLHALDWQKDIVRIHTILGGKNPHPNSLVGGVACAINLDEANALNSERLAFIGTLLEEAENFVEMVYLPDLLAIASFYKDWGAIGGGLPNYMSYGDFTDDSFV